MTDINQIREQIHNADTVVILSGAGLSAPSGIKTFRTNNGYWHQYKIEEVAHIKGFTKNPARGWDFYEQRRATLRTVVPNAGHFAISQFQQKHPNVSIITQNVDNLLEQAGCENVIHVHGLLTSTKCNNCDNVIEHDEQTRIDNHTCDVCGGILRPGVVMFGESLPVVEYDTAVQTIQHLTMSDVLIIVGSSLEVYPVSEWPIMSYYQGCLNIEINPDPVLSNMAIPINISCDEALPLLLSL